jgi:gamma-glutamylputrescine oxidase
MTLADRATRFLEISPYLDRPADVQASLDGDVRADVAIIGGGYTGLSTALALHEAGVSAVVLERHFCGFGASGRNAGHLTPTICKDLPTAKMLFGGDTAAELVRFADHCVERTEQAMRDYRIECDYQPTGNIMAVVHHSQQRRLRLATEAARALGARTRFVEAGEMRERGLPKAFICGALEEAGGTLHPGRLVLGLRRAALERGIRIFEQTTVTGVEPATPMRVIATRGSVSAERVLMATNAYAPEVGRPGQRLCPLYITLFETAPLTDAQLESIGGWNGREGIYTAHESMETFRLTAEQTIIGGSKDVRYFYDCRPHEHGGDADARKMSVIRAFRERFPELADLSIAHAWAGWCGFTLNFLPVVGRDPGNESYHYSVGYNGHGVAQAIAMGGLLADLITGGRNRWHDVICRKPAYMPPKPLRYLSVKALLGIVNGVDRNVDRKIRAQRRTGRQT